MNFLSQIVAVTGFGIRTMPKRGGSTLAAVVGIAGVVAVMVGVLSIARGFKATLANSGDAGVAMIMRAGATSEMMSGLSREDTNIIEDTEGIAMVDGQPMASSELFVVINLPKRNTGTDANVPLRGVERQAFLVRPKFEVVKGRLFEWGKNEVIVGASAASEFAGLDVGSSIQMGPIKWDVVGMFTDNGGVAESEIWTDAGILQPAYRRGDSFQSVYARLSSPDGFEAFKGSLMEDPRLTVKVIRQTEYYAEQSAQMETLILILGVVIAILMGLGAVFGALNTMYSAVSGRKREIATLRALGFTGAPIVISIWLEALVIALIGGSIGGAIAYVVFDGFQAATLNWSTFSQVAFAFKVDMPLLVAGISVSALIGLLGGALPSIRAARIPIAAALRES